MQLIIYVISTVLCSLYFLVNIMLAFPKLKDKAINNKNVEWLVLSLTIGTVVSVVYTTVNSNNPWLWIAMILNIISNLNWPRLFLTANTIKNNPNVVKWRNRITHIAIALNALILGYFLGVELGWW